MTTEHLMHWFSAGKPFAAVTLGQLWERGLCGLDDPVAQHLPEFAQHGKEAITLRHVLTHTGGFRSRVDLDWSAAPCGSSGCDWKLGLIGAIAFAVYSGLRHLGRPVAALSGEMQAFDAAVKKFLFDNMYRHDQVNRMTSKARVVVRELFQLILEKPGTMPTDWHRLADGRGTETTARVIADYIAGMTDRFALSEHERLLNFEK